MQQGIFNLDKWLLRLTIFMLLTSVIFFVITHEFVVLLVPFVFFYTLLIGSNWKAAYWILLFSIPFSVQISLMNDSLGLSLPDEPMSWLFLVLFILLASHRPDSLPRKWWEDPIVLVVILQLLWLIVAVIFSSVLLLSLKFLLAKFWYLACFFVLPIWVFKKKEDFRLAFRLLLFSMMATMIIIFIHHALLNFNFSQVGIALRWLFINHVEYGAVISIFFPIVCAAYPLTKNAAKWVRFLFLIILLFFLVAIYFSYARAALLAVVFAGIVAFATRLKLLNLVMPVCYAAIALLLVYLANDQKYLDLRPDYEHTLMHTSYANHITATIKGKDLSSMERLYRWVAAVRMSAYEPVTGFGPHGFYYNYKSYALPIFKTYVSKNPEHSTTHNYFLYMLTEQGWPAMLLYAILIMVVFAQAQKIYHRFKDRFYKYCTLGLTMAFAACFVNNFFSELIETHKVGALFYLILALLIILDKKSKEEQAGIVID